LVTTTAPHPENFRENKKLARRFFPYGLFTYFSFITNQYILMEFYKDKQSGEIFTEEEMLDMVDGDDQLGSFYFVGDFESHEEAESYLIE